ncbi:ADP-glyceromanno-heptose 6-epimerase [Nitratiruptor tergarcus]|uniref:ADP-L-glycero-D-manno-heptose 6-epimerase n=1 Tax=Nitratiruptor tergarcus DSM 16512 TaxID=1069081 RepID=A0A1W1WV01_9BACT|nr:ADP-glyceromanno-heptose 6-epimerase [Nitratiruptor tergarcus]SMC10151.1 ADP-L-glycero-D-manno-heptose 6-epimerase [Nitratiruptor tergarcus DSM 16512]
MIDFNRKTILITGGAGFIGSNLAFYFQEKFPEAKVIVFDKFRDESRFSNGNRTSFGHFKNLIGFQGEIISGDITNKEDLARLNDFKFDYIFHQAAISDTTVQDQKIMIDTNLNAFRDLLQMAKRHKAAMIYASSGAVYGKLPAPHKVGVEAPANIYGFSKLAMDYLAYEEMKKTDLPIVGLRYFNVYGPREYFKEKTASMVLQFGLQLLRGEKPRLFEGSDKIKRDFIFVEDVIQANIKACFAKKSGVYNVGTGKARSFKDIVDILCKELGIQREYEYIPNPYVKQYQFFTEADIAPTCEYLGYEPNYSLEEGIKADIPYIKKIYDEEIV